MRIELRPLRIALNLPVSHASHTRTTGESLLVTALDDGLCGLGEGCPRPYVTGETLEGSEGFLRDHLEEFEGLEDLEAIRAYVAAHQKELDTYPSAWCAMETALVDLHAQRAGIALEPLFDIDPTLDELIYTAVLFDVPQPVFDTLVGRHAKMGFKRFKLRACGVLDTDRRRLETVGATHPESIRIDANNRWRGDPDAAIRHLRALMEVTSIAAIEEPVGAGDVLGLSRIATALDLPVVLDESACRPSDLQRFEGVPGRYVVNIKVSKAGGLLRAMALADSAQERGWPVIIGAQVGETSILTRLGIVLARYLKEHALAQEGAYGTLLLTEEIVSPELRFGPGGRLVPSQAELGPYGLGLRLKDTGEVRS